MLSYLARRFGFSSGQISRKSSSCSPAGGSPGRSQIGRRSLRLEALEDRRLLSVTPYVVNSLEDTIAEDGLVTLREAIEAANTNAIVGDAHAGSAEVTDVITFSPEVYGGRIVSGRLAITESLEIRGPGTGLLTIDKHMNVDGLQVQDATDVSISGLTIEDANSAGIYAYNSTLTVSDVLIRGGFGSAIRASQSELIVTDSIFCGISGGRGAGIQASDTVTIVSGCSIFGNTCKQEAGAIYVYKGQLTLEDSRIEDNSTAGEGGGILAKLADSITIVNSTISGNSSASYGGGISIAAEQLTIHDSVISGNSCGTEAKGGGVYFDGGDALFDNVSIVDNSAGGAGGGMDASATGTVTLSGSRVLGNSSGRNGGGIRATASELTIHDSQVSNNQTSTFGGGLHTEGLLTIENSAVTGNTAGTGGGIHHLGPFNLSNSTVSENQSIDSVGGISTQGDATIVQSTITRNQSANTGGLAQSDGTAVLLNSVVAGNVAAASDGADLQGAFDAASHNNVIGIIDGASGLDADPGTQYGTASAPLDPMLRPLGHYGGPTPSHLPFSGSPLLDAGDDASAVDPEGNPLAADQRGNGFVRILGAAVDVGAVEGTDLIASTVKLETPSGPIGLFDSVETAWSVGGVPVEASIVFYADEDESLNGNEVVLREAPLDGAPTGTWSWRPCALGPGVYTFGAAIYDAEGTLLCEARTDDDVEIVGSTFTYLVDSAADTIAEDGMLTLREALAAVNSGKAVGDAPAPPADDNSTPVIHFGESLRGRTIVLSGTQLEITRPVAIEGPGAEWIAVDANRESRVFHIAGAEDVWISGMSLENGKEGGQHHSDLGKGGGILATGTQVVLSDMAIHGCYGYDGGGIFASSPLSISRSNIAGNRTLADSNRYGGGVYCTDTLEITDSGIYDNTAAFGSGVYASGTARIRNSTIACNAGIGFYNEGAATLVSVTISDNADEYRGSGGVANKGTLSIDQSTITGNHAWNGGGIFNDGGWVTLTNTIVAGNSADYGEPDVSGVFDSSSRGNLIGIISGSSGLTYDPSNQFGASATPLDPLLGPLAYNGGPTATRLLLPGSPALDAGVQGDLTATDQRGAGFPRVLGDAVDVGAIEGTESVTPRLDFDATTGEIDLRSPGWATWSVDGVSADAVLTLYADPDDALNGNEIQLGKETLSGRTGTVWSWYGLDTDLGKFTLVMTLCDPSANLLHETRLAETTTVVDCAADYVVTSTADTIAEDGLLTLREALEAINTGTAVGDAPGFTPLPDNSIAIVRFEDSLTGNTISLAEGALVLTHPVAILGCGRESLTIDADGQSRVFSATNARDVWIHDLTIEGGYSDNEDGGGGIRAVKTNLHVADTVFRRCSAATGGAIWITAGELTAVDSEFHDNTATAGAGGAISAGGEWNDLVQPCSIEHCLFAANAASGHRATGGAVSAEFYLLSIDKSTFQGNCAPSGGAIGVLTDTSIANSVFVANFADRGGAIYGGRSYPSVSLEVANSTLSGNTANQGGGILMNQAGKLTLLNSLLVNESSDDLYFDYQESDHASYNYCGRNNVLGLDPGFLRMPSDGSDGWGDDPETEDVDESMNDDLGDLRLRSDSLAIDAGVLRFSNTGDADGNPRLVGNAVDLGAYEFQGQIASEREMPSTIVTTATDVVDSRDQQISLREAILYAGGPDLGTVVKFDPQLSGRRLVLCGKPLFVDKELTIDASQAGTIAIDADGLSGVFEILGNSETPVSLVSLTVTNGTAATGGGINNDGAKLTIVHSTIIENEAGRGGGIFNRNAVLNIIESTISENSARDGGGILNCDGRLFLSDSHILRNRAIDGDGGAIGNNSDTNRHAAATLLNCIIAGNTSSRSGGAISITGKGGNNISTEIIQSVFVGNQSGTGGAIYLGFYQSLIISACTFVANGANEDSGGGIYNSGDLVLASSLLYANEGSDVRTVYGTTETPYTFMRADPRFVRNPSPGNDGVWGTEDDDYGDLRIHVDSFARDLGNNDLLPKDTFDLDGDGDLSELLPHDLAGNRRIQNGTVDIGAYENTSSVYVVDSLEDTIAEDGLITLREAIEAANTNAVVGDAHAGNSEETDVITFSVKVFSRTITLDKKHLAITDSLEIRSPGAGFLTIDASDSAFGFFIADAGEVSISGLTIQNSQQTGIFMYRSDLTVSGSVLQGCGSSGIGATDGTLSVTDCTFTENTADRGGGVRAEGTSVVLSNCSFANNSANYGGAVEAMGGSLTVSDCNITDNTGFTNGGGIGSLQNLLVITNSTIDGNWAGSKGGGIYANVDAVRIQNSTISRNVSELYGGGIYGVAEMLRITDSSIAENVGVSWGGGSLLYSDEPTILAGCAIVGNRVEGMYSTGGGIYGYQLHMANCTVSGNRSDYLAGGIAAHEGLTLIQSTVTRNEAVRTGGIWCNAEFDVTLFNSVVAQNTATEEVSTKSAVRAGDDWNKGYQVGETTPDLGGSFYLAGSHNFIGILDGIAGLDDTTYTQFGTAKAPLDPMLGPLDYYGGPTLGHLPLPGSSLLDAGDDDAAVDFEGNPLATDQRSEGFPRISGMGVDIGALEASPSCLYVVDSTADTIAEDGFITLREAIEAICTGTEVGDAPAPTYARGTYSAYVEFDASLQSQTIVLIQGELEITESIALRGLGAELLTIDAGGEDRAFAILEAGNVRISGLTIENGASSSNQRGGAIFTNHTDLLLDNMVVRHCDDDAISVYSGMLSVSDSTFVDNEHGAIQIRGNSQGPNSTHLIDNCLFLDNGNPSAGGGAFYSMYAPVVIMRSTFRRNKAAHGGAVYVHSGDIEIVNSAFVGNGANQGGAVYGGNYANITVTNSTLAGNVAFDGAGAYMYLDGDLTIQNSILFNDGRTEAFIDRGDYISENNLITIDPRFVRNPSDGGDGWGDDPDTADVDEAANDDYGDLRLRIDSSGRDAGSNAWLPDDISDLDGDGDVSEAIPIDLAGNSRVQNGVVDMGAYEFIAPEMAGDMNGDSVVNAADLDLVRAHWGRSVAAGDTFSGDANGDGMVNCADLDIVRANWTPAAQAAAADAVFAEQKAATDSTVYGPLSITVGRRDAALDFRALADFVWGKRGEGVAE